VTVLEVISNVRLKIRPMTH